MCPLMQLFLFWRLDAIFLAAKENKSLYWTNKADMAYTLAQDKQASAQASLAAACDALTNSTFDWMFFLLFFSLYSYIQQRGNVKAERKKIRKGSSL